MAGGRPRKYKEEYCEQAEKLCVIYGSDDEKLAKFFKVSESTINKWKLDYPGFSESIKRGKDVYDTEHVEASLLERACGYEHPEEKVFCQDGEIITHEQTKHYPPETTAAIFWLKNRHPERWRDIKGVDIKLNKEMLDAIFASLHPDFARELGEEIDKLLAE